MRESRETVFDKTVYFCACFLTNMCVHIHCTRDGYDRIVTQEATRAYI